LNPPASNHLIVFARLPVPGRTKTRLIPALGAEGAARLQVQMTRHVLRAVDALAAEGTLDVRVALDAGPTTDAAPWFGERACGLQAEGDLGVRLATAFDDAFAKGAKRVVVIGTDCPSLDADTLRRAFDALGGHGACLGPASDGGYYLLGLRAPEPQLFMDMPWSTKHVYRETLARLEDVGRSVARLQVLDDVDVPGDLPAAHRALERTVSVVVPTLNEAERLPACLDALLADPRAEVIVVDGGSTDYTVAIAQARGVAVLESAPGRAVQMNTGVEAACGDALVFCHADTHLPAGYVDTVRDTLHDHAVALGAFRLGLRGEERALRNIEAGVHWRSTRRKMPYGDQALFLRRRTFDALGGYRPLPIMEDYDLVRRARPLGRVAISDAVATSSARFWRRHGMVKGVVLNQLTLAGWHVGLRARHLRRIRSGRFFRRQHA